MRGLEKVRAEFSLTALVYNLRRVLNILGMDKLMAAVAAYHRPKSRCFVAKEHRGGPPRMPSKRLSARFQPETREKRRPARSVVVASINLDEFSHGLLEL